MVWDTGGGGLDGGWEWLPRLNAALNATCAVCLLAGRRAIRRGQKKIHQRWMLAAVGASTCFLVGYVSRLVLGGLHRFPEVGLLKTFYLTLLGTHTLLAIAVVPGVLRILYLAWKGRFKTHGRLARWVWPAWIYVSITGVVVYWMLYHVAPLL